MLTAACTCSSWTSRERSLVDAASSAKRILKSRDIARVVVVDDDVNRPSWYGLVDLLDSEDKAAIGQEFDFDLLNPGWRESLDLAAPEIRKGVAGRINSVVDDQDFPRPQREAEDPALVALKEVLRSHPLQQLTPSQWQARSDEFIRRAESEPTLFLIDQRLGDGREGGSLVKDLLARPSKGCFFCILTNDVDIDNEFDYWKTMCDKHGFQPGQVGIIAKAHLTGDQIGFARMLKISLTAGEVKDIQDGVLAAAREGLNAGLERFGDLDLPALTSIVFESSHLEGAWEIETILRVVKAFVGESLDSLVYGNQNVADAVKKIGAAASVSTGADERLREFAFEIQHAERYITDDYLSERRVALANGDLFEVTDTNNSVGLWVLVAQACDLAIRPNGKRNGSPTHLTVLPVERGKEVPRAAHMEFQHYFPPGSDRGFVRLTTPGHVPTAILDLAAFSATGEAVWVRGAEVDKMRVVGWERRARKVSEQLNGAFDDQDHLDDDMRRRIRELRLPAADRPEIRASVENDTIQYPIRRVARLRERYAETILQAFGLALSRTAEVHDLARISQ